MEVGAVHDTKFAMGPRWVEERRPEPLDPRICDVGLMGRANPVRNASQRFAHHREVEVQLDAVLGAQIKAEDDRVPFDGPIKPLLPSLDRHYQPGILFVVDEWFHSAIENGE